MNRINSSVSFCDIEGFFYYFSSFWKFVHEKKDAGLISLLHNKTPQLFRYSYKLELFSIELKHLLNNI